MTECCLCTVPGMGECDGTPGRGSGMLPTDDLEEGTFRAVGAWKCTWLSCWVLSEF